MYPVRPWRARKFLHEEWKKEMIQSNITYCCSFCLWSYMLKSDARGETMWGNFCLELYSVSLTFKKEIHWITCHNKKLYHNPNNFNLKFYSNFNLKFYSLSSTCTTWIYQLKLNYVAYHLESIENIPASTSSKKITTQFSGTMRISTTQHILSSNIKTTLGIVNLPTTPPLQPPLQQNNCLVWYCEHYY